MASPSPVRGAARPWPVLLTRAGLAGSESQSRRAAAPAPHSRHPIGAGLIAIQLPGDLGRNGCNVRDSWVSDDWMVVITVRGDHPVIIDSPHPRCGESGQFLRVHVTFSSLSGDSLDLAGPRWPGLVSAGISPADRGTYPGFGLADPASALVGPVTSLAVRAAPHVGGDVRPWPVMYPSRPGTSARWLWPPSWGAAGFERSSAPPGRRAFSLGQGQGFGAVRRAPGSDPPPGPFGPGPSIRD